MANTAAAQQARAEHMKVTFMAGTASAAAGGYSVGPVWGTDGLAFLVLGLVWLWGAGLVVLGLLTVAAMHPRTDQRAVWLRSESQHYAARVWSVSGVVLLCGCAVAVWVVGHPVV